MRTAHLIRVRCTFNGADTTKRLWLPEGISGADVLAKMQRYVPQRERSHIRLVSFTVDTDQSKSINL